MCNIIIYVINQKNIFEAFRKSERFLFYANNRRALVRLLGRKKFIQIIQKSRLITSLKCLGNLMLNTE